jgi:hypothetical protein
LNDRRLVINPSYGEDAAAFLRSVTFPTDELPKFTVASPCGGILVVPVAQYRAYGEVSAPRPRLRRSH